MTNISLDRLLETCQRNNATEALLVPGANPVVRLDQGWRALATKRLTLSDVVSMADAAVGRKPVQSDGYSHHDFKYGKARFRAVAFGYPKTRVLLLVHLSADRQDDPPLAVVG